MSTHFRIPFSLDENELTQILTEKQGNQEEILDLTASYLGHYQPLAQGNASARNAVASHWKRQRPLDPERFILTSSTSEAYSVLIKAFCEPEDEVLVPAPSYPLIEHLVHAEGCHPVFYPLAYAEGWFVDTAELSRRIHERTKMLVVVHPNNPTGNYLGQKQISELIHLAETHGLALVCDEVFYEYVLDRTRETISFADLPQPKCPLFILGGLSKLLGLPGYKLSWMYAHAEHHLMREFWPRLMWLQDLYLSVSSSAQDGLEKVFVSEKNRQTVIKERIRENDGHLRRLVKTSNRYQVVPADGGWNAVVELKGMQGDNAFAKALLSHSGVRVYPGSLFNMPFAASIVISLMTPTDEFLRGLSKLLEFEDTQTINL